MSLLHRDDLQITRNLAFVEDPDADDYQRPCPGCGDYCELASTDPDLYEAYGIDHCCGRTYHRQKAIWFVTLAWWTGGMPGRPGDILRLETHALELCDAEADMERRLAGLIANWAAAKLEADRDDP